MFSHKGMDVKSLSTTHLLGCKLNFYISNWNILYTNLISEDATQSRPHKTKVFKENIIYNIKIKYIFTKKHNMEIN